jgi:hypothetical protein
MCKFAQLYACHELFLKHTSRTSVIQVLISFYVTVAICRTFCICKNSSDYWKDTCSLPIDRKYQMGQSRDNCIIFKYLVQIQIIQNQFKISEGGQWNSHQMPCVYSSRMVEHYRICPIRFEIIFCHRQWLITYVVFWPPSEILNWFWIICIWTRYFKKKIWMLTWKTYLLCIFQHRFDWTIPA